MTALKGGTFFKNTEICDEFYLPRSMSVAVWFCPL